jgi:prevent-host-death family protein
MTTTTTIGSREARQNWRDLLDAAHTSGTDTIIERNGKPVAVLIPYEDYQALAEALADLRAARRVAETHRALQRGTTKGRSYDEIRAELEEKGLLDE